MKQYQKNVIEGTTTKLIIGAIIAAVLALCFGLGGCNSQKDETLQKIEYLYKQQLKDPASYERIEAVIYDTVHEKTALQLQLAEDSANYISAVNEYNADSIANLNDGFKPDEMHVILAPKRTKIAFAQDYIKLTENKLAGIKGDGEVAYLSVRLKYRAKNGFGALDVFEKIVRYSPADGTLLKDN